MTTEKYPGYDESDPSLNHRAHQKQLDREAYEADSTVTPKRMTKARGRANVARIGRMMSRFKLTN